MDQSYPLKPYASSGYPSQIHHGVASPPDLWQQSRFAPPFMAQGLAHPHRYQRTSSGYEPLTEAYTGYEPSPPQQIQRKARSSFQIIWWIPEVFASLLSVACLVAIIVILRYYDGRALIDINLPGSLTLNGIIAAISTLARVALMVPVASGLSQEAWIWFSDNHHSQKQCRSRLKDLDLSDDASRGAWGSVQFLLFARGRWVAYAGALATILTLGFGTFTQQLLAIGQFPVDGSSFLAPGSIPRAETWQYWNIRPSEGAQSLPLDLRAAVYNGMLTDKIDPVTATCATGNCTWPITPSLAVCGACSKAPYIQKCDTRLCNYTMASGNQIRLINTRDMGTGFSVNSTSQGGIYNGSIGDRAYILHFDAVGARYQSLSMGFSNSNVSSSECALWMCVQSFSTSMIAGKLQQNVTMEFSKLKRPTTQSIGTFDNYTFADLPAEMNPSAGTTYNVSLLGMSSFYSSLYKLFNGSAWLNQGGALTENDAVEAIWNASSNLDPWIKRVAESLTNALRYDNTNYAPPARQTLYPAPRRSIYDGTAYTLGIQVQWHWLVLPAVCVALSILFLVMVMIKTARSPVVPWKNSLLAILFFEVDHELKQRVSGRVNDWHGVLNAVGDDKVVLREEYEGKWTFKTA